jgi:drug/metabolite transporter (DMT)-like permease
VLAIALALGSSLAWGVSDFLGGLKSRSLPLLVVLLISQAAALIVLAAIVLSLGKGPPGGEFLLFAALAGLSEAVGVAALYRGLAVGATSIGHRSRPPLPWVPLVVGLALGELPTPIQGAGIALAVSGIVITACRPGQQHEPGRAVRASVFFGGLCALGFGCFYVAMDAASEGEIPWALLVARASAVTLFAAAIVPARPAAAVRGRDVPVIASIAVLIIAADAMYASSSTHGVLGVVAALSTLYPSSQSRFRVSTWESRSIATSSSGSRSRLPASWRSPPASDQPRPILPARTCRDSSRSSSSDTPRSSRPIWRASTSSSSRRASADRLDAWTRHGGAIPRRPADREAAGS